VYSAALPKPLALYINPGGLENSDFDPTCPVKLVTSDQSVSGVIWIDSWSVVPVESINSIFPHPLASNKLLGKMLDTSNCMFGAKS
jgi:hypothetical protein